MDTSARFDDNCVGVRTGYLQTNPTVPPLHQLVRLHGACPRMYTLFLEFIITHKLT
jgi:hypothetical protein